MSIRHHGDDVVLHREVPDWIRELDHCGSVDYCDVATGTVDARVDLSPEQWMRVLLQPSDLRILLLLGVAAVTQHAVLGFRPARGSWGERLYGWRIAARRDSWVRLEAASWMLSGHIVIHRDGRRLSFATFVRYQRPIARRVWPAVAPLHRRVAVALVRNAVRTTRAATVRSRHAGVAT